MALQIWEIANKKEGVPTPTMNPTFKKRICNHLVCGKNKRMGLMTWWTHEGVPFRKKACLEGTKRCGIKRNAKQKRSAEQGFCPKCD